MITRLFDLSNRRSRGAGQSWTMLIGALALILILALVACSGGEATPTVEAPAAAPTSAPTEAPMEAPTEAPTVTSQPTDTPEPTATSEPTDTPEPVAAAGDSCLIGTWEITDMGGYINSLLPDVSGLEYLGQDGYARFTYDENNQVTFEADNFTNQFSGSIEGVSLNLEVIMSGTGTGTYAVEGDQIIYSDSTANQLTFSATLNGTPLFSNQVSDLGNLFGAPQSTTAEPFTYSCQGDTLEYIPPIPDAQPVVLTRVGS